MRICKGLAGTVLIVAMLVGATVAKADTIYGYVWLDYQSRIGGNVTINTNSGTMWGNTGTVGLGEFAFDVTGFGLSGGTTTSTVYEQLLAAEVKFNTTQEALLYGYCIDTGQWLDEGNNMYQMRPLEEIFTMKGVAAATATARSNDLRKLYNQDLTAVDKLQFGIAVWEIMYEDDSATYGYDTTDGDFALDGTWTTAQGYLGNLSSTLNNDIFALYDPVNQDFSIVIKGGGAVVPEPFTMATAFLAIGSFGMYIRKHTRKRT